MGLSHYENYREPKVVLATTMMVWNAVLTLAMAFYWSGLAAYMAEPLRWAMRLSVSLQPAWIEYPYLMLWLVPMLCMCGAWVALKGNQVGIARILGLYPSLTLSLMLGWYYLAPQHWH